MRPKPKQFTGTIYDHPQLRGRFSAMAASNDPEEYRRIGGEARRRVVGIRFTCGGCGAYVGRVELLNDTALIETMGGPNVPTVTLGEPHEHYEVLDDDGNVTKEWWPCPRGCVSASGERRGVQLTTDTVRAWLEEIASNVGPNARKIITRKF